MSWEICITAEGWSEIREQLDNPEIWTPEMLARALAAHDAEVYDYSDLDDLERYESARTLFWREFPDDILADKCFELIERNNTCDNGGNGYYIDRDGIFQVFLD